jgi:hypothetical protein
LALAAAEARIAELARKIESSPAAARRRDGPPRADQIHVSGSTARLARKLCYGVPRLGSVFDINGVW